jgi:hypothetical protein
LEFLEKLHHSTPVLLKQRFLASPLLLHRNYRSTLNIKMPFRNPFKGHKKQHGSDNPIENANTDCRRSQEQLPYHDAPATRGQHVAQGTQKRAPSSTSMDMKEPQPSSQHQAPSDEQALPPTYSTAVQSQPPQYRSLKPDPFDPTGPCYGYQYEENAQNFPHPSSVSKDIGKEMKYNDPKAADLARRANQSGQGYLTEMMNYFLRQQELGKQSIDNTILAWNGV